MQKAEKLTKKTCPLENKCLIAIFFSRFSFLVEYQHIAIPDTPQSYKCQKYRVQQKTKMKIETNTLPDVNTDMPANSLANHWQKVSKKGK